MSGFTDEVDRIVRYKIFCITFCILLFIAVLVVVADAGYRKGKDQACELTAPTKQCTPPHVTCNDANCVYLN